MSSVWKQLGAPLFRVDNIYTTFPLSRTAECAQLLAPAAGSATVPCGQHLHHFSTQQSSWMCAVIGSSSYAYWLQLERHTLAFIFHSSFQTVTYVSHLFIAFCSVPPSWQHWQTWCRGWDGALQNTGIGLAQEHGDQAQGSGGDRLLGSIPFSPEEGGSIFQRHSPKATLLTVTAVVISNPINLFKSFGANEDSNFRDPVCINTFRTRLEHL
jgi:hypothetical protein